MFSMPVHAKNITTYDQQDYISVPGNKSIDSKQYSSDISKDEKSFKNFLLKNEVSEESICNLMDQYVF